MGLYNYPDVYDALRAPDQETLDFVVKAINQHLKIPLRSVMDPACGPGNWLVPFARNSVYVAGNDLEPAMVRVARQRLNGYPAELTMGDMRELTFKTGPFDVALEVAGTVAMLEDLESLTRFFRTVAAQVNPGGLFLLTVFLSESISHLELPHVTWRMGPVDIPNGGRAWVTYEVIERDNAREAIRRSVSTADVPGCPEKIEDVYWLRTWSINEIHEAVRQVSELELVESYSLDTHLVDSPWSVEDTGEHLFVFRRV